MVAIAMPPFDVVLRICLFPVAWLFGQRRLPVSMPRIAPMCKPTRIRRSAQTCQSACGVMPLPVPDNRLDLLRIGYYANAMRV